LRVRTQASSTCCGDCERSETNASFAGPWFAPYRSLIERIGVPMRVRTQAPRGWHPGQHDRQDEWDKSAQWIERVTTIAREADLRVGLSGQVPLRFVRAGDLPAADYERRIAEQGLVACRVGGDAEWHDWFNALVWLVFPATKAALNREHLSQMDFDAIRASGQPNLRNPADRAHPTASAVRSGNRRGARRDRLTLLDENGVCLVSDSDWIGDALSRHDWKTLFVARRDPFRAQASVVVFGHGLLHRLLKPYKGACGHLLTLKGCSSLSRASALSQAPGGPSGVHDRAFEDLDRRLSALVARVAGDPPLRLGHLPILGVPGWWSANEDASFYEDTAVFRPMCEPARMSPWAAPPG
jgi:Protein of unknown function (DUF3025)